MIVRVSGFVYYECFDPHATDWPREHPEVGEPTVVRIGKGRQMRYDVSTETACAMLEHAATFGDAMSYGVDDPSVGRRVLAWVEREHERLGLAKSYVNGWVRFDAPVLATCSCEGGFDADCELHGRAEA